MRITKKEYHMDYVDEKKIKRKYVYCEKCQDQITFETVWRTQKAMFHGYIIPTYYCKTCYPTKEDLVNAVYFKK